MNQENSTETSSIAKDSNASDSAAARKSAAPPPPPASFPFLVSMLGTQALAAMGHFGNDPNAPQPSLEYAKHYIDLLGVLEEKTKNNLSSEELGLLQDWLHQLRMGYIEFAKQSKH